MSKKKKIFIAIFVLVLVAGGIILAINLLNPKPNMEAPYQNFYTVVNHKDIDTITTNNNNIIEYMEDFTDDSLKTAAAPYLTKYNSAKNILLSYEESNVFIETNILYLTDYDKNLVKIQRELTESHENVLEKYTACVNYIKSDIVPKKSNANSWTMMQAIISYDKLFVELLTELSNFYEITAKLYSSYATSTINSNPYTKQNVLSTAIWAKSIVQKISTNSLDGIVDASKNLLNFVSISFTSNPNMYFDKFEHYNALLEDINNMPSDIYTALSSNTQESYLSNITDEIQKSNIRIILNTYFMFDIIDLPLPQDPPVDPNPPIVEEGGVE